MSGQHRATAGAAHCQLFPVTSHAHAHTLTDHRAPILWRFWLLYSIFYIFPGHEQQLPFWWVKSHLIIPQTHPTAKGKRTDRFRYIPLFPKQKNQKSENGLCNFQTLREKNAVSKTWLISQKARNGRRKRNHKDGREDTQGVSKRFKHIIQYNKLWIHCYQWKERHSDWIFENPVICDL